MAQSSTFLRRNEPWILLSIAAIVAVVTWGPDLLRDRSSQAAKVGKRPSPVGPFAQVQEQPSSRRRDTPSQVLSQPQLLLDLHDPAAIERRLFEDAKYLASDALEGRGPKTRGLELAADYIAEQYRSAGLDISRYDGTPFQPFQQRTEIAPTDRTRVTVITGQGERQDLQVGRQVTPLSLGKAGTFDLPLVFAGYGITAAEHGYDDYEHLDVAGKAVVVLRHEPQQGDAASVFAGRRNSKYAYLSYKVENAMSHGAAAIVFVTDNYQRQQELSRDSSGTRGEETLLKFQVRGSLQPSIPVLHCRRDVVDRLLASCGLASLAECETAIDEEFRPRSDMMSQCRIVGEVHLRRSQRSLKNVVGVLPGRGKLADETIIVGAHYDHLGLGGSGSLAAWTVEVHNGADDNASGTAALLETARQTAVKAADARRRIVFIAFSAEEMGLIGSEYYANHPLFDLEDTVAMLNFDMVGRLSAKRHLFLHGTGTAKEFEPLLDRLASRRDLSVQRRRGGYGPSDHATFYGRGIPVLHFFTGLHNDYHRPSDDYDKLNVPGMREITLLASDILWELATAEQRPTKTSAGDLSLDDSSLFASPSRTSRRGPYIGVAVSPAGDQLMVQSVVRGGPADQAQLRPGDIILRAGGRPVNTSRDLIEFVTQHQAGDEFPVVIRRGEIDLEVTLKVGDR